VRGDTPAASPRTRAFSPSAAVAMTSRHADPERAGRTGVHVAAAFR
jgi:hypothetical protein